MGPAAIVVGGGVSPTPGWLRRAPSWSCPGPKGGSSRCVGVGARADLPGSRRRFEWTSLSLALVIMGMTSLFVWRWRARNAGNEAFQVPEPADVSRVHATGSHVAQPRGRVKVIGRLRCETSCLYLVSSVFDQASRRWEECGWPPRSDAFDASAGVSCRSTGVGAHATSERDPRDQARTCGGGGSRRGACASRSFTPPVRRPHQTERPLAWAVEDSNL